MGLDVITPESIYGYEPDNSLPISPGQHVYSTESIILPDTSLFVEENKNSRQQGPLIVFPKYNNYLLDHSKFDQNSRILVPMSLLGIKPIEHGEITLKHSLPVNGAVVSYAQYKEAGLLLSKKYDDSVVRRWGVDITVGSPLISVSVLVPEYSSDVPKPIPTKPSVVFKDVKAPDTKYINDPWDKNMAFDDENDLGYIKKRIKRNSYSEKNIVYKSLSGIRLSTPVKLQIWLNPNHTIFNERSNPQCVHWSTVRG